MHRATRIAGLLLPLTLLAGCGGTAETTSADRAAVDAPAAQPVSSREADGDALVAKLRTALEQLTTTRFEVRLTGRLEASATGAADLTTDPPSVQLTPETPLFGVSEVRLVKGVAYAEMEGQWVKADLATLLSMLPVDVADLDLDQLADALAGSLSDVDVSGDTGEEVWNATVDPAQLLADAGALDGHVIEGDGAVDLTATFQGDELDALVVDLGDTGTVELTLLDQGEPVRITAPRGDVTDFTDFGWFAMTPEKPGG